MEEQVKASSSSSSVVALPPPQPVEYDLGSTTGCIDYILCCFPADRHTEIRPLAEFYVSEDVRAKAAKGSPLWAEFTKKVIKSRILESSQGRKEWIAAVSYNRSLRFAPAPKVVQNTC